MLSTILEILLFKRSIFDWYSLLLYYSGNIANSSSLYLRYSSTHKPRSSLADDRPTSMTSLIKILRALGHFSRGVIGFSLPLSICSYIRLSVFCNASVIIKFFFGLFFMRNAIRSSGSTLEVLSSF